MLTLPVRVGGIETRAVLDSGATRFAVDAAFAAAFDAPDIETAMVRRLAGHDGLIFDGRELRFFMNIGAILETAKLVGCDIIKMEYRSSHNLL